MRQNELDQKLSQVFRSFQGKQPSAAAIAKAQQTFDRLLSQCSRGQDVLINSFNSARDYWHVPSRGTPHSYADHIRAVLQAGFPLCAERLFCVYVDSMADLDADAVESAIASPACIDAWLKRRKINKKSLLKQLLSDTSHCYQSVWADWLVNKVPLKSVAPLALLAADGRQRQFPLPSAQSLLGTVLARDKTGALCKLLLPAPLSDEVRLERILTAALDAPTSIGVYAAYVASVLVGKHAAESIVNVRTAVVSLLSSTTQGALERVSHFLSHLVSSWNLGISKTTPTTIGPELISLAERVVLLGQANPDRDLWVMAPVKALLELLTSSTDQKLSAQAAGMLASALRAVQMNSDASRALWSAAFNLGIREFEKPGDSIVFDPFRHEDVEGGLLRGHTCTVIDCGWETSGLVLERARVKPSS